jgi:RNA polymerase sigma-70 factor (ECF subfamily)
MNDSEATDFADVLADARRGDDAAFRLLFRAHQPPLMRYLRASTRDDADDLSAETWATVASSLDGFDGGESEFRAWLFTIARSRRADLARRRARRPVTATLDDVEVADAADVESAVGEILTTETAVALVASLPPDQAEVVLLRHLAGLDVALAAQVLGKSRAAVRVLSHRGLRSLAARLAEPELPTPVPEGTRRRGGV